MGEGQVHVNRMLKFNKNPNWQCVSKGRFHVMYTAQTSSECSSMPRPVYGAAGSELASRKGSEQAVKRQGCSETPGKGSAQAVTRQGKAAHRQ